MKGGYGRGREGWGTERQGERESALSSYAYFKAMCNRPKMPLSI